LITFEPLTLPSRFSTISLPLLAVIYASPPLPSQR
jgi:hypothetical protein